MPQYNVTKSNLIWPMIYDCMRGKKEQCNPKCVYSEPSPIKWNGTCSQVNTVCIGFLLLSIQFRGRAVLPEWKNTFKSITQTEMGTGSHLSLIFLPVNWLIERCGGAFQWFWKKSFEQQWIFLTSCSKCFSYYSYTTILYNRGCGGAVG